MSTTGILFPHQLFEQNRLVSKCDTIYLVEEILFFKQYNFHKQKIVFHRASMKFYEGYLISKNIQVVYIDSHNELSDVRKLIPYLKLQNIQSFEYIDTTDYWLEQRISKACRTNKLVANKNRSPLFLNSPEEIILSENEFAKKSYCNHLKVLGHQTL
jgi:deoxyribodipyrimidine photolyase-related protein